MTLPDLPVCEPEADSLPESLQLEIEHSVAQFTEKLGILKSLPMASEWITEYRAEVIRMVRLGMEARD